MAIDEAERRYICRRNKGLQSAVDGTASPARTGDPQIHNLVL